MSKYRMMINKASGERYALLKDGSKVFESVNPTEYKRIRKLAINNARRAAYDSIMRDCGLVKVRGAVSGKVYWE